MSQVGGQHREQVLDIAALLIPSYKPVNCKRMPQIVNSGLVCREIMAEDSCSLPEPAETTLHSLLCNRLGPFALKHVSDRPVAPVGLLDAGQEVGEHPVRLVQVVTCRTSFLQS